MENTGVDVAVLDEIGTHLAEIFATLSKNYTVCGTMVGALVVGPSPGYSFLNELMMARYSLQLLKEHGIARNGRQRGLHIAEVRAREVGTTVESLK